MKPTLGEFELELLGYIADFGPMSAREAFDGFGVPRGVARTTILKTMDRLLAKNFLIRAEKDGLWIYQSAHSKAEIENDAIGRFVATTLSGNIEPLMLYLDGSAKLNSEDIALLRNLVDRLEAEDKK